MNVTFINHRDSGGGAEQFTMDLHGKVPNSSVIVGTSNRPKITTLNRKDPSIIDKSVQKLTKRSSYRHLLGIHDLLHGTYRKLKRTREYQEADIIHLNNIHGGWFNINALKRIDAEKKVVWTLHDMWAMTGGEAHIFDDVGYQIGRAKTPFIAHYPLNNPWIDTRKGNLTRKKNIYAKLRNTVFVPVSSWLEDCLKSSFVYNPSMKIHTIKNGVDTNIFTDTKNRKSAGRKRILFFNLNSPFKGTSVGLDVLKKVQNDHEILIIGDVPHNLNHYTHIAQKIQDRTELSRIYNAVDILLFPSLAENMPLTVLEAMSCGVAVVSTPVGGIPEIIKDGESGYLSPTTNTDGVYHALLRAFKDNLYDIGTKASAFILNNHSHVQMVKDYHELYVDLLYD